MSTIMRYVGMDVHAESIAMAVVDSDGTERDVGVIPNRPAAIRKCLKKLGRAEEVHCCYEAGPTGYVRYWQVVRMGSECPVVAPTVIPTKAGERVKTDRRDARKLARYLRSGALTAVGSPMQPTRRCAIWAARGRPPRSMRSAPASASRSFCCGTASGRPRG